MKAILPVLVFALALVPVGAVASDIGRLGKLEPDITLTSTKNIFDIERCIIEMDGPGIPSVYRQPDRPQRSQIAYSAGVGVTLLITLVQESTDSKVEVRRGRLGFRKGPIPEMLKSCV